MEDDGQGDEMDVDDQEDKLEDDVLEDDDVQDEDEDEDDDDDQEGEDKDDGQEGNDEVVRSDDEEDDMDTFIEASGCEPKEEIRLWPDLRVQIKADLEAAHKKNESLTHIKELLALQNFATL